MDRDQPAYAGRETMKLKHALIAARQKQHRNKYNFMCIGFSSPVGPYSSFVEKYFEYQDGSVRCDFGFMVNKMYDRK